MSFQDLFPHSSKHAGSDTGTKVALSAAAFAGAAYMGFRLARLVNYWGGSTEEKIDESSAISSSQLVTTSSNSVAKLNRGGVDDLTATASTYLSHLAQTQVIGTPNTIFQRRLRQMNATTGSMPRRGPSFSLPDTPTGVFFPMNMPLDVGINMLLRSDENDTRKAVMQITSPHVRQKMQALQHTVKSIKTRVEQEPEEAYDTVTQLDAKCLVQLVNRIKDLKDEELITKLLTAIANCASLKENQERLFDATCAEVLVDLIRSSAPASVRSTALQALSNLAVNSEKGASLKICIPDLFNTLSSSAPSAASNEAQVRKNCLVLLGNLALFREAAAFSFTGPQLQYLFDEVSFNESTQPQHTMQQHERPSFIKDDELCGEQLLACKVLVNLASDAEKAKSILNSEIQHDFQHTFRSLLWQYVADADNGQEKSLRFSKNLLLRYLYLMKNLYRQSIALMQSVNGPSSANLTVSSTERISRSSSNLFPQPNTLGYCLLMLAGPIMNASMTSSVSANQSSMIRLVADLSALKHRGSAVGRGEDADLVSNADDLIKLVEDAEQCRVQHSGDASGTRRTLSPRPK